MIYCETDFDVPVTIDFLSGEACIFTCRSPDKESVNEDSVALIPFGSDSGIIAVADGLGGLPSGSQASCVAIESLNKVISSRSENSNLRDAILDSYEYANQAIMNKGNGSATTLALAELQGNELRAYHVGDSKILVCGQRGKIKVNTVSHSPVEYAVEAGMLDENEAVHHEERHLVSNIVGSSDMSITIGTSIKLANFDTVLVASDGIFDNLYLHEVVELVRKGPLAQAAGKLLEILASRMTSIDTGMPGHADDHSFILFRLKS